MEIENRVIITISNFKSETYDLTQFQQQYYSVQLIFEALASIILSLIYAIMSYYDNYKE